MVTMGRPKRNVPPDAIEVRIFLDRELWAYYRELAAARRQTVNALVVLALSEHPHCLAKDGRLLPYDFD
jgi:hypothetical protein